MRNFIKITLALALTATTAILFSGCTTPRGSCCEKILSESDNFTGNCMADHLKIYVEFNFFSFEREKVNDAVRQLKHNPNLSLLIECHSFFPACTNLMKNYLIDLGVDAGRIRKLTGGSEYQVLVMPSNISLQVRDENKSTWKEEPVVYNNFIYTS